LRLKAQTTLTASITPPYYVQSFVAGFVRCIEVKPCIEVYVI